MESSRFFTENQGLTRETIEIDPEFFLEITPKGPFKRVVSL